MLAGGRARMTGTLRAALTWYYFIPHSGDAGRCWYRRFLEAGGMDMCIALEQALELAKAGRAAEGAPLLIDTSRHLQVHRKAASAALWLVLRRHYLGVHAYFRYLRGDYRRASALLERASVAALHAIDEAPFLLTLASSEYEFCLHHARIARNQRLWAEMRAWLDSGRAMVRSERPLCRLPSGRLVFLRELDAIYEAMTPENDLEQEALRVLTDAAVREAQFERMARSIEVLGTVVVPFQ